MLQRVMKLLTHGTLDVGRKRLLSRDRLREVVVEFCLPPCRGAKRRTSCFMQQSGLVVPNLAFAGRLFQAMLVIYRLGGYATPSVVMFSTNRLFSAWE